MHKLIDRQIILHFVFTLCSREWYANAQCDWLFRRRPLSGAFTHPSCMVYPPGEPEPEPEPEPAPKPAEERVWERPTYTIEAFENPSK